MLPAVELVTVCERVLLTLFRFSTTRFHTSFVCACHSRCSAQEYRLQQHGRFAISLTLNE